MILVVRDVTSVGCKLASVKRELDMAQCDVVSNGRELTTNDDEVSAS